MRTDRRTWIVAGADRIPAKASAAVWCAGSSGVSGECGRLLPGERQLRVRYRGDRRAAAVRRRHRWSGRWAGALEVWLKPMVGREYLVAVWIRRAAGVRAITRRCRVSWDYGYRVAMRGVPGSMRFAVELAERAAVARPRSTNGAIVDRRRRNNHGAGLCWRYLTGTVKYASGSSSRRGRRGWLTTALVGVPGRAWLGNRIEQIAGRLAGRSVMSAADWFCG